MHGCVVAGIGTGVGKTVVAAIVAEKWRADYWKPVQAGELHASDTMKVRQLAPEAARFHAEAYRLNSAISPHAAAELDGVQIERTKLALPVTENRLVVELAGGLFVPLAPGLRNIDLLSEWKLPVLLVANYYLGSINHTLLSIEALQTRDIPLLGLVFNGNPLKSSRQAILEESGLPCLLDMARADRIDASWVAKQAESLQL